MSKFINLHNHSSYSLLDGFSSLEGLAKTAADMDMSHVALTDHGNIDGSIDFTRACERYGIKGIVGCEFYIVEDASIKTKGESRSHLIALAKTERGFQNIMKMVTISNMDNFYFRGRIDPEILLRHSEDVIISTACSASFIRFGWGRKMYEDLYKKQKDDLYLEIMPVDLKEQKEVNQICLDMQKIYGSKLIASCDSHYLRKEDSKSQEVMLAIQSNKKWSDPLRWKFSGGSYHFMGKRDIVMAFVNQNQLDREIFMNAIFNTQEIADKIEFHKISKKSPRLPRVAAVGENSDINFLKKLCNEKFKIMYPDPPPEYVQRLTEEMDLIEKKNFERYFLLLWEIVNFCKEQDIMVGPGRGSSAGSLICYLLGVTRVDPIKYGLLFSRFLAPDRQDLPDADMDFEDRKRPLIKKHLEELYGRWNVAGISTFSVLRGKGALRDVCRVFEIPLQEVNKVCSIVETKIGGEEGFGETLEEAFDNFDEGKAFKERYPEVAEIAINIEGVTKNRGMHAAAIVISDTDLRSGDGCALVLGKDKEPTINWDKSNIEHMSYVKMDILGLRMLSVLNYCKELIKENHNIDIDFDKIPLDDSLCYKEFSKGQNIGCFQVGSPGLRKFCQQLGIDDFGTLVHVTAVYRPGTLHSGQAEVFTKRKRGEEQIPTQHPIIEEITKETYGVILFQEQLMLLVHKLAGLEWSIVDRIRKDVSKSKGVEALRKYEEQFVEGCLNQKTIREDQARNLWNDLVNFGSYSFNKSHSVVYSIITYWDMWLKVYYPVEFMCALLTYGTGDEEMKSEYIEEAFRLKLDIRPPKIGISKSDQWQIQDNILYAPFSEISGVGDKTAAGFEKLGKKKGFIEEKEPVSKRFLNILEKIGAYEDKALTDEEADEVSQYLGISLVRNKLYKYKKLIKLIDKDLGFSKVKDINLHEPESQDKYYFGLITELNLSVKKGKENKFTAANASFKDETGSCKISFAKEFYDAFPSEIEHCEGEIILLRANTSKRAGSVRVEKAWFQDDLLSAEFGDLGLNILETKRFQNYAVEDCEECDLCKKDMIPRVPKSGRYNIMVVGETGIDIGYDFLRELKKNDIKERDLNFSSFIKCPLKSAKEVARKHVETCSTWLEEEVKEIGPCLILGIGNTAVKFFTEEDTGINNLNGTTVWNEKYGCYVAFCTSPSTLYYGGNNIVQFQDGVKNFCEKAKNMGLGLF